MKMGAPSRWGLGARLALLAGLPAVLLVAVAVLTYRANVEERRSAETRSAVLVAQAIGSTVDGFTRDLESMTLAVALALGRDAGPIDQSTAGAYLASASSLHTALQGFLLTDTTGRVIATKSNTNIGLDLSDRPYIVGLQRGADSVWMNALTGIRTGRTVTAFARVVRSPEGTPRAYLIAAFYPDLLLERLPVTLPPDASITLIDGDGVVLYTTDGRVLSPDEYDVSGAPGVSAALAGQLVPLSAVESPFRGEQRFGALVPVSRSRWAVAFTRPQAALESALLTSFFYQVGAIAAVTTIATILTLLLARRLTRPLRELADTARAIARGDRPEIRDVSSDAEVTQLAQAMRIMSTAVAAREQSLQEQREWLREILASIGDAVVVTDRDGRITFINGVAQSLTRWTEEAAVGKRLPEIVTFIDEQTRAALEDPTEQMIRTGTTVGLATPACLLARDGAEIPIEDSAAPVRDASGQIIGTVLIFRDTTDRKRAEAADRFLARAGDLLATSLDYEATLSQVGRLAVPVMADLCIVDVLDEDGSIGHSAVAHVDPVKEDLMRELRRRYPPRRTESLIVSQVLQTGRSQLFPEFHDSLVASVAQDSAHLQGLRTIGLRSMMSVALLARGRTLGAVTFIVSESDRRFTEADLALAEELARRAALAVENAQLYRESQRAIHARDKFMSIAAHELKTPLTSLKGFAQLLARGRGDSARAVEQIVAQTNRLDRLISDLLDITRLEVGAMALNVAPVDLVALARQAADEAAALSSQHRIQVEADSPELLGTWDGERLRQVLENLLSNAVKYSPEPGEVVVRIDQTKTEARVSVQDSGCGLSPESLSRVFDQFYRVPDTASAADGLGLGLHIARSLVEAHGGTIWAESAGEGQGSTFVFTLPHRH